MVEDAAQRYWRKVRTLQEREMEAQIQRERRFAETGDRGTLEGQGEHDSAPDGGLYLMSLENDERCTVGGRVSSVPWVNQIIGRKLADKTHRVATAQEIERFQKDAAERQARMESVQERIDRRTAVHIKPLAPIAKAGK